MIMVNNHIKRKLGIRAAFWCIASMFLFEQINHSFLARFEIDATNSQTTVRGDSAESDVLFCCGETRAEIPLPRLLSLQTTLAPFRAHSTIDADSHFTIKNTQLAILPAETIPLKLRV
jgi:hypothetical protein